MADIQQAAIWMREGKKVAISTWYRVALGLKPGSRQELCLYDLDDENKECKYIAYLFDMESKDWEIVDNDQPLR